MVEKDTLAIVIPAYKKDFLYETLTSFANQTNKNFVIYIGDDSSPYDIKSIVEKFKDKLSIVYYRFDKNLGGTSLTKHWERCIDLSNEEWIWLFSDDDIVDPNCVDIFCNRQDVQSKFFKFETKVIDNNGKHIFHKFDDKNRYFSKLSSEKFINRRLNCENFRSFAVEYIFHRDLYKKLKFVEFPLAWASDDASWFNYSLENGGYISGLNAVVKWRFSGQNISSSVKNMETNLKKTEASVQYVQWLKECCKLNNIPLIEEKALGWFSIQIASLRSPVSFSKFNNFISQMGLLISKREIIKNFLIIKYYHLRNRLR